MHLSLYWFLLQVTLNCPLFFCFRFHPQDHSAGVSGPGETAELSRFGVGIVTFLWASFTRLSAWVMSPRAYVHASILASISSVLPETKPVLFFYRNGPFLMCVQPPTHVFVSTRASPLSLDFSPPGFTAFSFTHTPFPFFNRLFQPKYYVTSSPSQLFFFLNCCPRLLFPERISGWRRWAFFLQ